MKNKNKVAVAAATCRACGHKLDASEYYCPACNTPHFAHLKPALASPMISLTTFVLIIAAPVAVWTFYELIMRFAAKL